MTDLEKTKALTPDHLAKALPSFQKEFLLSAPSETSTPKKSNSKSLLEMPETAVSSGTQIGGESGAWQRDPSQKPASDAKQPQKKEGAEQRGAFPDPSKILTQEGPEGIRFDFNLGPRLYVPKGEYRVRLVDVDTCTLLYETAGSDMTFLGRKRHFMRVKMEVFKENKPVFSHEWDGRNQEIAIILPGGTLGDSIGWFSYAALFAKKHACRLTIALSSHMLALFKPCYPEISFVTHEDFEAIKANFYATYYVGLYFKDEDNSFQPSDFRMMGLHEQAASILGLEGEAECPPFVDCLKPDKRPVKEPYVVIATQGSSACKLWNNPYGWHETIDWLKAQGYRVICIDKEKITGFGCFLNYIPHNVEDQTGPRPLSERVRWLKHAEFFIGLSSGLSWLAWASGVPVIMISGFTHPCNEFKTPYRAFSTHVCNSCWHDVRTPFEHHNYLFCPRQKDTSRQFECTRTISSGYVIKLAMQLMRDKNLTPPIKRVKQRKKSAQTKITASAEQKNLKNTSSRKQIKKKEAAFTPESPVSIGN